MYYEKATELYRDISINSQLYYLKIYPTNTPCLFLIDKVMGVLWPFSQGQMQIFLGPEVYVILLTFKKRNTKFLMKN